MSELQGEWGNNFHPIIAKGFSYNIRHVRASMSWKMRGPATSNWGRFLCIYRGSRKFITYCTTIFFKSICLKLHTSFVCWCSRPFWSWVIVYAHTTTTKTISPTRNRTTVHCELPTNIIQSTVDFCGILMYDLWSEIVAVPETPTGSICALDNKYLCKVFCPQEGPSLDISQFTRQKKGVW